MNENTKNLLKLVSENPNLPVVPMADSDIVCDDGSNYWMGAFGSVEVGEYAVYDDRVFTDRDEFKETFYDNEQNVLYDMFGYNPRINEFSVKAGQFTQRGHEENLQKEAKLDAYLNKVADDYFEKAIIVYIGCPDN